MDSKEALREIETKLMDLEPEDRLRLVAGILAFVTRPHELNEITTLIHHQRNTLVRKSTLGR